MVVDTIYSTLPPFSFIDRNGRPFSEKHVEGKIIVADFFFTRCTTICPRMKVQMQQLQFKLDDAAFLRRVSLDLTGLPPAPELVVCEKLAPETCKPRKLARLLREQRFAPGQLRTDFHLILRSSWSAYAG